MQRSKIEETTGLKVDNSFVDVLYQQQKRLDYEQEIKVALEIPQERMEEGLKMPGLSMDNSCFGYLIQDTFECDSSSSNIRLF